jgi:hypothetical protein
MVATRLYGESCNTCGDNQNGDKRKRAPEIRHAVPVPFEGKFKSKHIATAQTKALRKQRVRLLEKRTKGNSNCSE